MKLSLMPTWMPPFCLKPLEPLHAWWYHWSLGEALHMIEMLLCSYRLWISWTCSPYLLKKHLMDQMTHSVVSCGLVSPWTWWGLKPSYTCWLCGALGHLMVVKKERSSLHAKQIFLQQGALDLGALWCMLDWVHLKDDEQINFTRRNSASKHIYAIGVVGT